MFTGLIEEVGKLKHVRRQGEAMVLEISAKKVLKDIALGDSIAVNGVCLTAIQFDASSVSMDVMPETFRRTTLSRLQPGEPVNLERAMQANGRFGGHIVQGHADGTGTIRAREPKDNAVYFSIEPHDPELFRYIIPKGSITVDGISLTVVDADSHSFRISVIPHTLSETALHHKGPGAEVNLETDIIGKYVDHLLSKSTPQQSERKSGLSEQMLRDYGFM